MAKTFLKESRLPLPPKIKRRGRLASQTDTMLKMNVPPSESVTARTLLEESRQALPTIKPSGRLASKRDSLPEAEFQKRILTGAIILVALTVLSSVLFVGLRSHSKAVTVSPFGYVSVGAVSPGHQEEVVGARKFEQTAGTGQNGNLSAEETVELVRKALNNTDVAQVESFFVLGDSAATPPEAIELSKRIQAEDGLPHGIEYLGEKVIPGGVAKEVMVSSVKGDQESNRLGQLLYRSGRWLIDMDSYARHVSPGWGHILEHKCDSATVRVFVSPDNYYNGERYVEDAWKCYALISPDVDEILFGYVARGSVQDQAMESLMAKEEQLHRATIEVLLGEKVNGRMQFEISRVLSDDWIIGGTSYDDSSWSSSRN